MTRTRPAKTVAASDTASTTVPTSPTTRPASSAAFVAMPVTWLATAPTGSVVPAGATTARRGPVLAMPSTASTRFVYTPFPSHPRSNTNVNSNSCKNSAADLPASKPVLETHPTAHPTARSPGSVVVLLLALPRVDLPPGAQGARMATRAKAAVQHPGPATATATAAAGTITVGTAMDATTMDATTMVLHLAALPVRPLGTSLLERSRMDIPVTATVPLLA